MFVPLFDVDQALAEVNNVRHHVDALLGSRGLDGRHGLHNLRRGLPFQWREDEDAAVLTLDVPGVGLEDVDISVNNHQLEIRLARLLAEADDITVKHRERRSFEWQRTLSLPDHVDVERIEARMNHGVLEVRLPRMPEAAPRKITVQS